MKLDYFKSVGTLWILFWICLSVYGTLVFDSIACLWISVMSFLGIFFYEVDDEIRSYYKKLKGDEE